MPLYRNVCSLAVFLITFLPVAVGQGKYTQIDYPGALFTAAYGVNSSGDVSGWYEDAGDILHGFLLSGGSFATIDYPGAASTTVFGMNNVGQIVGYSDNPAVGFAYDISSQTFTEIAYPNSPFGTRIYSINDSGEAVGYFYDSEEQPTAFTWSDSIFYQIAPEGSTASVVFGIADDGDVVGYFLNSQFKEDFAFYQGRYSRIAIPNAEQAYVLGINPGATALVGSYAPKPRLTAGFLYQNKVLKTLQYPRSIETVANGISSTGEVVGYFVDASGYIHGFTWTPPSDGSQR